MTAAKSLESPKLSNYNVCTEQFLSVEFQTFSVEQNGANWADRGNNSQYHFRNCAAGIPPKCDAASVKFLHVAIIR